MTRTALPLNLFFLFVAGLFLNLQPTQAIGNTEDLQPSFVDFHKSVINGEADVLRGVYVPNLFALPVVQQPEDQPYYVSNHDGQITQFSVASQYGNIGLLAHNNLSGRFFTQLAVGQPVLLVYGDGKVEAYVIGQILRFQALEPESISSSFRNLDENETLSSGEMFSRAYVGERHLVFQTCIAAEGNASWGRLFIIAAPAK
jgi:hypothetical protein